MAKTPPIGPGDVTIGDTLEVDGKLFRVTGFTGKGVTMVTTKGSPATYTYDAPTLPIPPVKYGDMVRVVGTRRTHHLGHIGTISGFLDDGRISVTAVGHCGCTDTCFWGGPAREGDDSRVTKSIQFARDELELVTGAPRTLRIEIDLEPDESPDTDDPIALIDFLAEHHQLVRAQIQKRLHPVILEQELIIAALNIWAVGAGVTALALMVLITMSPIPLETPERTMALVLFTAFFWPIVLPVVVAILSNLGKWR